MSLPRMNVAVLIMVMGLCSSSFAWAVQPPDAGEPAQRREPISYRDIVKKVLPAVVSVESFARDGGKSAASRSPANPNESRPSPDGPPFVPGPNDHPSRIGFGSGFIVHSRGVVVTNNHLVEGADKVVVQLNTGKKFTAKKVSTDPKTDLAVLRVEPTDPLPSLEFGDSDLMEIGDRVLAVGAPFGLTGTVTHGILSSKGRSLKMNLYEDFLQTDAAINPGNSGGPLISLEGKVIGVNSAIKSRSGGFQGIGLAISSNLARRVVDALEAEGVVRRGYLGVGFIDVDEDIQQQLDLEQATGVKITRIYTNAPGVRAGLKVNDVILRVAGKPVSDGRNLQMVVTGLPLGKPADVEIVRDGKTQTVPVTIEEQPTNFGMAKKTETPKQTKEAIILERLGMALADLTPEIAETLGFPNTLRGVFIAQIKEGGLAQTAGLKAGQVILSINRRAVTTARAVAAQLTNADTARGVLIRVRGPRTDPEEFILGTDN
ncbi:MAG: trypsin-like peptidase domain-containing protein [Gemmataceae bacterium]